MRDWDSGLGWKRSSTAVRGRGHCAWAPALSDEDRRAIEEIRRQIDIEFAPSALTEAMRSENSRGSASRFLPSPAVAWGLLAGFLLGGAVAGAAIYYLKVADVSRPVRVSGPVEPVHRAEALPPAVAKPGTVSASALPAEPTADAARATPATAERPGLPPAPERTGQLVSSWTSTAPRTPSR